MNKLFILSVIAVFLVFPIAAMDQERDEWATVGKKKKTSSAIKKKEIDKQIVAIVQS